MTDFQGNLHNVTVSQSSNIDLTQDSYTKGLDPSRKAKVDDPMECDPIDFI